MNVGGKVYQIHLIIVTSWIVVIKYSIACYDAHKYEKFSSENISFLIWKYSDYPDTLRLNYYRFLFLAAAFVNKKIKFLV